MNFARRLVCLKHQRIDFTGRPYLPAMYGSTARNIVVRAGRQVEKSTFMCVLILHLAATCPGVQILYVCPRQEQGRMFVRTRLRPMLANSPILCRVLANDKPGRLAMDNVQFANGSCLFVRAAYHSADAARGISADLLLIDEFQDVKSGDLPVLQETLSHSDMARTILTGTPKLDDNAIESMFRRSTANEWLITCIKCGRDVRLDERCIGPTSLICPECQTALDKLAGRWVPMNPGATWGDGFWLPGLAVPWKKHELILENQRTYDYARFHNEVLGLSVSLGAHMVTREQLEACCTNTPMAQGIEDIHPSFRENLVVGVDWGGGGVARTAIVVGFARPDGNFEICHLARIAAREDPELVKQQVLEICRKFRARWVAADGLGNGSVYNVLLLKGMGHRCWLYALSYSATDSDAVQDGGLFKWRIGRTNSISFLFTCVKNKNILFPRLSDCASFLDEFACVTAEYDDKNRCIKYTHPEDQPDDTVHATNYALQIARRGFATLIAGIE